MRTKGNPFLTLSLTCLTKAYISLPDSPDVIVVRHRANPHTKEQVRINGGRLSPDVNNTESSTSAQDSVKPK